MTKYLLPAFLFAGFLFASDPAHAMRCGNKLVLEGMLDIEVRAHCGEPTAVRDLGYVVRPYHPLARRNVPGALIFRYGPGHYYQELQVTEYIYNLGPRKLMRKLRFEGGILARIDTLGHGYVEQDK